MCTLAPPPKHTQSSKIIHHKTKEIPKISVPKTEELRYERLRQVTGGISVLFGHLFKHSFIHPLFIRFLSIHIHVLTYSYKEELQNIDLLASSMMDIQIPQNSMQILLYKLWPEGISTWICWKFLLSVSPPGAWTMDEGSPATAGSSSSFSDPLYR